MMLSGYSEKFRLEIIQSAIRGYEKQCEAADRGIRPLHRNRGFQKEERWKKKALSKTIWFRPNNSVGFVPATPNGVLARTIQAIVSEEAARIGLTVRIVEQGGISLKQQLVRMDLTGCFYPDCYLCESGTTGGSHTRSGAHYSGICVLCQQAGKEARYDGETGRSAYWRTTKSHKPQIMSNADSNGFAKHLQVYHPENIRDPSAFKIKVESNHSKCLERQVKEGTYITNSEADYVINSKSEFHQPSVRRVVTTREVRNSGL